MVEQQQRERERFERFFGWCRRGRWHLRRHRVCNPWGLGFLAFACYFGSAVLRP